MGLLRTLALVVTLSGACASNAERESAPGPGVRNGHGLAFDGRVSVLFGGATGSAVVDDSWGWDGTAWSLLSNSGPPPRTFPVMVADPGSGAVYLFGGNRVLFGTTPSPSNLLADLWRWDRRSWTPIMAAKGPSGRAEAAASWDVRRGRLVMFGGYRVNGTVLERLGDTWEFDGAAWSLVSSAGPSPRSGAVMAYDAVRGETLLYGGSGAANDTWSWDGQRWVRLAQGNDPGRYNAAMVWDALQNAAIRFGGWDGRGRTGDTWLWRSGTWTAWIGHGPSPRNHAAATVDSRRERLVLVGGHDGERVFGDVWEWTYTSGWREAFTVAPVFRVANGH